MLFWLAVGAIAFIVVGATVLMVALCTLLFLVGAIVDLFSYLKVSKRRRDDGKNNPDIV